VARTPLPALAAAVSFVDGVNRTDLDGLTALLHADHQLVVFDEPPVVGRDATVEAWRGYFTAFPEYVIYPRVLVEHGTRVAVLGNTTGSHLGLPDDDELALVVIWIAEVDQGRLTRWHVCEDSPALRGALGLPV
jgi:ketosteroid isomerase-like protein